MAEKLFNAGPWIESGYSDWYPDRHEGQGDTTWTVIRSDADDVDVAIVMTPTRWGDTTVLDANARLIAAAPDLLAACLAFLAYDQGDDDAPDAGVRMMLDYDHALTLALVATTNALGQPASLARNTGENSNGEAAA